MNRNQYMDAMYKRLEGDMATTLENYREIMATLKRLEYEFETIKTEYPKYKPKAIKTRYYDLKLEIMHYRDELQLCVDLMLIGIHPDGFIRAYGQAKDEILDYLSRYEEDPVLNTFMSDHTLSAYLRYDRKTKEITYKVDLIHTGNEKLPFIKMTDEYCDVSLFSGPINVPWTTYPTLSELHSYWKKVEPVKANLHRNFKQNERNHTIPTAPELLAYYFKHELCVEGDIPGAVFKLTDERPEVDFFCQSSQRLYP